MEKPGKNSSRILVFRIGQLGDTLVALPAMWAVKTQFPEAHLALLCDRHPGKSFVLASDLLRGTGIFSGFLSYPVTGSGGITKLFSMVSLLAAIRKGRFDTLVYLAPSGRTSNQIERDRRFFSLAGIKTFVGMDGFAALEIKKPGVPLAETPRESELLLKRLSFFAPTYNYRKDLALGAGEEKEVADWLARQNSDGGRRWVAFAPGSKMPAKRWPLERFIEVGRGLIEPYDIWPVVFGGAEDAGDANRLIEAWGRGYNAAGELSVRASGFALKRCALYLGNDTGTMHLAAAEDTKCVAVFSSRDRPGRWNPAGTGHRIFRSPIECEGCGLMECVERKNECLDRISSAQVLAGCSSILAAVLVK